MDFFRRNTSPWYWGYSFQGLVILGFLPILLPLFAAEELSPSRVGVVVAAVYAGQLTAPLLGSLAEKWKCYGLFFLGGYFLIGLGFLGFVLYTSLTLWVLQSLLIGIGSGATNTIGGVYIVEYFPKDSWDRRIGWMQTFYGAGQAIGVFGMTALSKVPSKAMVLCAAVMLPGFLFSYWTIPSSPKSSQAKSPPGHSVVRHSLSAGHHYHSISWDTFTLWVKKWDSLFTLYLLSWFLMMLGTFMIYNLYPLLMKSSFRLQPELSSLFFAIGATLGVVFYPLSGILAKKIGDNRVLLFGYFLTLASVLLLSFCAYIDLPWIWTTLIVALAVILLTVAWSPLIVAGTAETANLAIVEEGEALGLFNATTAIASILAAVLAGQIAEKVSYNAVAAAACFIVIASQILFLPLLRRKKESP